MTRDEAAANRSSLGDHSSERVTAEPTREWLLPGADELFRGIYARVGGEAQGILAVCSAIAGEGKTTISLGLGITIAQDLPEHRVLVVESDLQRPTFAEDFGFAPAPGLVDCLQEDQPLQTAYRATLLDNLHLLPAGRPPSNPSRLLRSGRMAAAADAMRQTHDLVILDVPAVLASSDALTLLDLADAAICVVRAGVTPTLLVRKAIEQIDRSKFRGLVLNGADSAIPGRLRRVCGL